MKQAEIDGLRARPVPPQHHLIAGRAVESREGARIDAVSPIDGRLPATLADGGGGKIDTLKTAWIAR